MTTYILKKGEKVLASSTPKYDKDEWGDSDLDGMTSGVATPEEIKAFEAAGGAITPLRD